MNRITAAIESKKATIADRIAKGLTTKAAVAKTRKALDMDVSEHAKFQELKSLATLEGTLTPEEGQTVYVLLGECVSTFNRQPVEVKAVLTGLFRELLERRIAAKR